MNIAATQYSVKNKALEVYVSGCDGLCGCDCHNRELWNFKLGRDYTEFIPEIQRKVEDFPTLIENLWVLGGEPMLQDEDELFNLLENLHSIGLPVTLFTRMEIQDIPEGIKELCQYIKTGPYIQELLSENYCSRGVKLATMNQKMLKKGLDY